MPRQMKTSQAVFHPPLSRQYYSEYIFIISIPKNCLKYQPKSIFNINYGSGIQKKGN